MQFCLCVDDVDLRKRFEQEPLSTHAEATTTVQLQCSAPPALPAPQVTVSQFSLPVPPFPSLPIPLLQPTHPTPPLYLSLSSPHLVTPSRSGNGL